MFAVSYGRKTISWLHQKSIGSLTSITFPVQFKCIPMYLNLTLFFVAFWRPLNYRSNHLQNVFICIIYRKHQVAFLLDIFAPIAVLNDLLFHNHHRHWWINDLIRFNSSSFANQILDKCNLPYMQWWPIRAYTNQI